MMSLGPLVRREGIAQAYGVTTTQTQTHTQPVPEGRRPRRPHRAWAVAAVTFVTIVGAAAFASLPGLLIEPLHDPDTGFGWSRGAIGFAVSVNLALYGVTAPFAAALMDRYGIRKVV